MQGRDLIALRNEALVAFAAQPTEKQPAARSWQHHLAIVATAVTLSGALVVWLNIVGVLKTTPAKEAPSVQSVSTEAQTPPPDVEIARSFEIMAAANPTERTEEAAAVPPEPEALLPKIPGFCLDLVGRECHAQDRVVSRKAAVFADVDALVGKIQGCKQ